MALTHSPSVAVVLPGTGSDAHFVDHAFRGPLAARSVRTIAIEPDPRRVVGSYLDAMDAAATEYGQILVGVCPSVLPSHCSGQRSIRTRRRGVGGVATVDRSAGSRTGGGKRTVHVVTTTQRRPGIGDCGDARIQPGLVGTRTGALVAFAVAGSARSARRSRDVLLTDRSGSRRSTSPSELR